MSDMDLEHNLQEVANAMRGEEGGVNTAQKRKRESESADDTRRGNKRVSPNANKDHQDGVEALQDYNSLHQGGQLDGHNGTEHATTAAAALAGLYPGMTVPQPTDVSFATQGSDGNQDSSFMDNSQAQDSYIDSATPSGGRGDRKPAVGSEEWHKVRKDNHKEGV